MAIKKYIILFALILFSCNDEFQPEINCDCGIVEVKSITGQCHYLGVRNECTSNIKNVCYDFTEWNQAILNRRYCNKKVNY